MASLILPNLCFRSSWIVSIFTDRHRSDQCAHHRRVGHGTADFVDGYLAGVDGEYLAARQPSFLRRSAGVIEVFTRRTPFSLSPSHTSTASKSVGSRTTTTSGE